MARRMTKGECEFCGEVVGKRALIRHLRDHLDSWRGLRDARWEDPVDMIHILVDGRYRPEYWMHLEARGDTTLAELDGMLRNEWLECCDHLSGFIIGGERFVSNPWGDAPGGPGVDMELHRVLVKGVEFEHLYDFGSTTYLRLRVVGWRRGPPEPVTIRLLARNEPPTFECVRCGRPAEHVCTGCYEGREGTHLCGGCGADHDCDEYRLMPITNSPRCGVCAYDGLG